MKTEITRSSWDDVVFESRNKEYGAYSIRKSYEENITMASLMMILFASFVVGCLQIASLMHIKIKMPVHVVDHGGFTNPPIVIPNPSDKPPASKETQNVNRNLLEKVVTHVVEPTPLKATFPERETGTGTLPSGGADLGKGDGLIPVVVDPPKILVFAEVMPEYDGGMSAMLKFLRKNLHYPSNARMMGIEGSVYVRFVVNGQGAVTDIEVIKGVNGALDKEAMRVIAMMPNWKPGRQHDIPVSVRMVLPIKFKLESE